MTVFKTFWKIVNKYKGTIILYTVMLISFGGINLASNDTTTTFTSTLPNIAIVNNDQKSVLTNNLINYLSENSKVVDIENDEEKINDALFYRDVSYVVYIPKNYTNDVLKGMNPTIDIKSTNDYTSSLEEMMLTDYLNLQNTYLKLTTDQTKLTNYINDTLKDKSKVVLTSKVDTKSLSKVSRYFNFASYSILAVVIFIITLVLTSFKEKTVLMLTHDFQPIIDYVHGNFFTRYGLITPVHASFIQNIEGSICESPITMNDLKNTVELTKDIVMSSNASMAVKIVNLRKYVELTKPEFGTSAIYEVLSNVIHGRQNPIYKDGQEISADVLEQGMREVSQYIPNKSYTDLINGTSTEILISSMSSDDLYHRIISIRLLFERVEGTLSLLRKKYPAACKFVNETNHVENDYIYQLDPRKYFGIPNYYLQQIENFIQENKETILAGNILTENTELDQIGDN